MKKGLLAILLIAPAILIAQPPANYYNAASGQSCSGLKTALRNIINGGVSPQTYNSLWTQYLSSDLKPREVAVTPSQTSMGVQTSTNVIWDIYSDNPSGTDPYNLTPGTVGSGGQQDDGSSGTSESQRYNREHSVPQSWFNGNTGTPGPTTDYHHIFPTDKKVNAERGNFPYGEVATASWTSLNGGKLGTSSVAGITGTVFEPINQYKGDVARAFLYFVTMYQDNMSTWASNAEAVQAFEPNTFPSVDIAFLRLMIKWHNQDPVSQKEIDRNNAGYSFQNNRNPFVDHPEYVGQVWNSTCPGLSALPVDLIFFAGKLEGGKINLSWDVATEINLDRYEIERSFNGTDYTKIGTVKAENKSSYGYSDNIENLGGRRIYYRLKNVDKDGSFKYSAVFSIHIPLNTKFSVYPNPASSEIRMQLNRTGNEKATVTVTEITGKIVLQKQVITNQGLIIIPTAGLNSGSYVVKLITDKEEYSQRVLILK